MPETANDRDVRVTEIIDAHRATPGAALAVLLAIQAELGHVPRDAVPQVAAALNLSRAEIHGVLTFYHDLRTEPAGRHVLKLCRAEACQSLGAEAVAARALARVPGWGATSADGRLTVAPAYCLGLCACSPAALLDGAPVGRLDPARRDALLDARP
jgi:formate dehydrogenase subunit gamma